MSLYHEAATILSNSATSAGSLKSQVFSNRKERKSNPGSLFALVAETVKWQAILKNVVERSDVLKAEKKLTPALALVLAHDLILSKGGVALPTSHPLRIAITKHKTRLNAEFTKTRIRHGFRSFEALKEHVNSVQNGRTEEEVEEKRRHEHPRWIRVNSIETTLEKQLKTTFTGYDLAELLSDVLVAGPTAKILHVDRHIPNLLALPRNADFTKSEAYKKGEIIFQDKASCFPSYLLAGDRSEGDLIDACAAPGNKTTHLAALVGETSWSNTNEKKSKVFAFEKDKARGDTLRRMVKLAGAGATVSIQSPQDFLQVDMRSSSMKNVTGILLDPSCSGSGIVGRDDFIRVELPTLPTAADVVTPRGKKRKRKNRKAEEPESNGNGAPTTTELVSEETPDDGDTSASLQDRLTSLSAFQHRLLIHSMHYPSAHRITYSTCSIHFAENEGVVLHALSSEIAQRRGWRIMSREEQPEGLRKWEVRGTKEEAPKGDILSSNDEGEVFEGCIRCEKGTGEGTMGFFVAGFVRDERVAVDNNASGDGKEEDGWQEDENGDEWGGFDDTD